MADQRDRAALAERRELEDAIERSPMEADNYVMLGAVLVAAFHEPDTAQKLLQHAIELRPDSVDARFWLAKVHYHDTALWETAVELLTDALLRDPNRADCLDLRGASKRFLGEPVKTYVNDFQRAVQLEPDWIIPRVNLAQAWLEMGERRSAERELSSIESIPRLKDSPAETVRRYYESAVTGRLAESETLEHTIQRLRNRIESRSWRHLFG